MEAEYLVSRIEQFVVKFDINFRDNSLQDSFIFAIE